MDDVEVTDDEVADPDATPVQFLAVPPEPLWRRAVVGSRSGKASSLVWILAGIAGLSLWCAFFALVLGSVQAHRSQRNLYATIRSEIAAQTLPIDGDIPRGCAVGVDADPRHRCAQPRRRRGNVGRRNLEDAPGHRRDTPLPGQIGTSVVMGRGLLFGAPFAHVPDLHVGDIIRVTTGRWRFPLQRRGCSPQRAMRGQRPITSPEGRLTLIASEAVGAGLGAVRSSVYVDAILIDPARPASQGRPTTIDANESSMSGDMSALPDLVGWLLALIGAVAAIKWLLGRFGGWQTAIVGVPVLLALLWLAAESASQLLPNLM